MAELLNNKEELSELFPEAFLTYAKTVITNRSLPDIAGCKPVHNAILWAMKENNLASNKPRAKSAKVVGSVLSLHPHGDSAAYEAAVRLSLNHVMRYPLIESESSMGDITGSGPAHMRYTEMRPSEYGDLMLEGLDKDAVDFDSGDTGDPDVSMPQIMSGAFPNILVNGNEGIAVGLACSWLPHNLGEVVDGINAYIDNNDITIEELMEHIKGPDFPLGGTVINQDSLLESYTLGRSKETVKIRGDYTIDGKVVHFTSIPYGVTTGLIVKQINDNVEELSAYIDDYENSTKRDVDIKFYFKSEELVEPGLNVLFKRTSLQHYASINMNLKVGNGFKEHMSLKEVIEEYVKHQMQVILRTTTFDYNKAKDKQHLLEGQAKVLADIDEVVKIIRSSKSNKEARELLEERYNLSEIQSKNVLSIRLARLNSMEIEDVKNKLEETNQEVSELAEIIESEEKQGQILKDKLNYIKENYGDERRTKLDNVVIQSPEELIPETPPTPVKVGFVESMQHIKLVVSSYQGAQLVDTKLNEKIVLFTNLGNAYKLDVEEIPSGATNISTILKMKPGEKVLSIMPMDAYVPIIAVTRAGTTKRVDPKEFSSNQRTSYIKLRDGDEVLGVCGDARGVEYIKQTTEQGRELTFEVDKINPTGRNSIGVIGIKLKDGDTLKSVEFLKSLGDNVVGNRNTLGKVVK